MKKLGGVALVLVLLMAPAVRVMAQATTDTGTSTENVAPQMEMSTIGTITEVDLANGTMTLDNGMEFKLAPSFQYTSAPAVGQNVEVIYDEQGSQKTAHSVDVGFEGPSND